MYYLNLKMFKNDHYYVILQCNNNNGIYICIYNFLFCLKLLLEINYLFMKSIEYIKTCKLHLLLLLSSLYTN